MKYILLFAFVGIVNFGFSQSNTFWTGGDVAGGDWNDAASWITVVDGGDVDGIPDADDIVWIGQSAELIVSGSEECLDLFMYAADYLLFTIDAGAKVKVFDDVKLLDSADAAYIEITIDGTWQVVDNFRVDLGDADGLGLGDHEVLFTINETGLLDIDDVSDNWNRFLDCSTVDYTVNGTVDCVGGFEFWIDNATVAVLNIGATATVNVGDDFKQKVYEPNCSMTTNVLGILDVSDDIIFDKVINGDPTKNVIDMDNTSTPEVFCGGTIGTPTEGTVNNGTNTSTFTFDGTVNQLIPTASTIVFNDLVIAKGTGVATLSGNLPNTQVLGNLNVTSGTLALASQTLVSTKDVNNAGTITADGTLTVGDSLVNSGTINQSAAMTITGHTNNSGTINQTAAITATGNITNSGTINTSTSIDANGNFTNSGTLASTGVGITLAGNWNNTGGTYTFNALDSITFDGTTGLNTIDGATNWNTLIINHAGTGVDVNSGAQTIRKILDLDQGTFSVDAAASVTLLSDASGSAQLDVIETGAAWDGASNLTVQRYIPKVAQSFTSLGSPVSGTTLASWQDDNIIYTGDGAGTFTGADFETFGWHNTYWYDEGAANGVMNDGFTKATTTAQAVGASNSYRAFHIYTDAVTYNIDVTGVPNTGNVSIPLAYDGAFAGNQAGWNLIANPYACTIDFNAIYAAGMVNGYFVYNDGNANYDWYDGSDGSNLVSMTRYIPHTQGFWVRSTGLTSISITESDKRRTDQAFYKSSNNVNLMRVKLTGNVNMFLDAAVIIERNDFSNGYEVDVDIQKFKTLNPDNAPTISTFTNDGYEVCFNRISGESISIPLDAKAGTLAQGLYTMDFDIPSTFMEGACITLEDLHTGTITDLRADTSYSYTTSDTTTLPRFIIHLVKDINTNATALTCFGTNDGVVAITGNGITGSSFSLLDGAGNVINTGTASNDSITFNNVSGGTYEVSTNYTGGCSSNNTYAITVAEPMLVTADFSLLQDTLYLDQNDILEVANNSSGTNFVWDFGDGNTSTFVNPTHTYISPGVYPVMLTSNNDNVGQCTEVTTKNVVVMSAPLSIEEVLNDNSTKAYVRKGYIVVEFDLENETELEIVLIDINGKKITNTLEYISSGRIDLISTDVLANGVYIVNIIGNNQTISKKLIIE